MKIILASISPRRKKLLNRLGITFDIIPSNINEGQVPTNIHAQEYCLKLAKLKTEKISKQFTNSLIIGADTIVVINDQILNKPKDYFEANDMLKILNNKTHKVYTGIYLKYLDKNIEHSFYETSEVTFNKLTDNEIKYYINNYKPFDKSGAYGIQDWSAIFVKRIVGCYDNVMGLPISRLYQELKKLNINLLDSTLKKS